MVKYWKISPGEKASDWELFQNTSCIGIGWLEDLDFYEFSDQDSILAALEERYRKKTPGSGKGAAKMIWSFVHEVKVKDIVVANDRYNRMVGIGIVTSDYLSPKFHGNPLRSDSSTHRHHARLVDWVITAPADIVPAPPKKYFFVQSTMKELMPEQAASIVQAYVTAYPDNASLQHDLKRLFHLKDLPKPEQESIPDVDFRGITSSKGEGQKRLSLHVRRERDRALIAMKKASVDPPICEVCGFDSQETYGVDYCEAHHLTPLSDLEEGTQTRLEDLAIVCANCHRIIHSQYPPLDLDELREMYQG